MRFDISLPWSVHTNLITGRMFIHIGCGSNDIVILGIVQVD